MKFLTVLLLLLLTVSPALAAEDEGPAYGMQSHSVTSAEECLKQLDPDEALDVRKNAAMPWQECQRRLQEKLKQEREKKQSEEAEAEREPTPPPAETPRNYIRVQKPETESRTHQGSGQETKKNTKKEEKD